MIEIHKGVYGLPQAGILANKQLRHHLQKYSYNQISTHGLFIHTTRDITFTLVVNDFVIVCTSIDDLNRIRSAVKPLYTTTFENSGALYCGMKLD